MTGEREAEFRRLYLQLRIRDQRAYYEGRRTEYDRAHRQSVIVRNVLFMVAGMCAIAGQIVEGAARAGWSVGAAVLGGLAAAVVGYESLIGFSRLSSLYGDVAHNLAEAELDWDDSGTPTHIAAEVQRVEEVLRGENGQWGQLVIESAAGPGITPEGLSPGSSDPSGPGLA